MKLKNILSSLPFMKEQLKDAHHEARLIVEEAKLKAKEELVQAKDEALEVKKRAEKELMRAQSEINQAKSRLQAKEAEVHSLKQSYTEKLQTIEKEQEMIKKQKDLILAKLESVAQMTKHEAKDMILKGWEDRLKVDIAKRIKAAEEKVKLEADTKAQEILIDAMRHGSNDYIAEYTLSTVDLPDDKVKGRIIGKDGRNIRAFEQATGVDVDLEEEGVIKLSSFDAYRREVARRSLEKLIKDGRVQPVRIEEIVRQTKQDLEKITFEAGKDLAQRVNVYDLPRDLIAMLGKFKYRYSYGQNMIEHTLEETKIGIALAHELGADVLTVKLGCLFHDIGKIVENKEGSHVDLGVELLRKYKIPEAAVHCVASSHEDIPFESVEAIIVHIADGISGARPGARHEDFGQYLQRIKDIENIAFEFKNVKDAYALQAGRELRVIVKPDAVSDDEAVVMAQNIKDKVNEKFPIFPGQVTITVIRETRAVATSHSDK